MLALIEIIYDTGLWELFFLLLLLLFNKTIYQNPPDLWCCIKYSASSLVVPLTALLLTSRSKIMAKFPVARWKE